MSKSKKLPKYVTHTMLAQFARAADASFAVKLAAMEDRLREEFTPAQVIAATDCAFTADGGYEQTDATYEGNHLAPTPAEGAE